MSPGAMAVRENNSVLPRGKRRNPRKTFLSTTGIASIKSDNVTSVGAGCSFTFSGVAAGGVSSVSSVSCAVFPPEEKNTWFLVISMMRVLLDDLSTSSIE